MLRVIEIRDNVDGFLSFDLRDLLPAIASSGAQLHWTIFGLECTPTPNDAERIAQVEEASRSSTGVPITWPELIALGTDVIQVLDGLFVGVADPQNALQESDAYRLGELVLEAVDSGFWRVGAASEDVVRALRSRFSDVRDTAPPPSA